MTNMTINSLLEEMTISEEDLKESEQKSPEWIASKDKLLVAILHNISENNKKSE